MVIDFRPAQPEESEQLASIIQETSGGLADYLLTGLIPFTSPHQLLTSQVIRKDSIYSYKNIIVCSENDNIIAVLLAYPWQNQVESELTRQFLSKQKYNIVKDLLNSAYPDSLFLNTVWVARSCRGRGLADNLLELAAAWAQEEKLTHLSLHVWQENKRAINFYNRHGFQPDKTFSFPEHKLLAYPGNKLQMCKKLS